MRIVVLGVIAAAVVSVSVATQPRSPLDAPLSAFRVPNTLPPCGISTAIAHLEREANVPVGFERTSACMGGASFPKLDLSSDTTDLGGASVRVALDRLMAMEPSYRWFEMDGIAVVRPAASWEDSTNALNRIYVPAFVMDSANASRVLSTLLKVPPHEAPIDQPEFTLTFNGGAMVEALNALIRARRGVGWDAGLLVHPSTSGEDRSPTFTVTIRTFQAGANRAGPGGITIGTPLPRLLANR